MFVLLLLSGLLLAIDARVQLNAPLNLESRQSFEIASGSRLDRNLSKAMDDGLFSSLRQRAYLSLYARAQGATASIKAGEYALEPGLTPLGLLALWVSGKTVQHELRLIEGWRFAQALASVRQNPDLLQTLGEADAATIMALLGHPGLPAEGRFFPDTYLFSKGTSDIALLRSAFAALDRILDSEWAQRGPNLPYVKPEQALIMASIIEKESGRSAEREQIAGVFVRRLRLGMRLQTDPSVIYGMGDAYDGNIRSGDLVRDTPYNSYTRDGLPPTPICLPGRDSIHAALHPDDGKALYFVSRGDGSHQFSATLEEHNEAVRRFQLRSGGSR
ncbi:MAG: endolytic transglycosylase MltG [Nevskia sp.]